jgi:hypothetical protein
VLKENGEKRSKLGEEKAEFFIATPQAEKFAVWTEKINFRARTTRPGKKWMETPEYVLVEISKGIYGLAQAGRLAQDRPVALLKDNGYCLNPCIFRHRVRVAPLSSNVAVIPAMHSCGTLIRL